MLQMGWNYFFFKQKTAYEMRISDWSSDVCSSDLRAAQPDDRFLAHMRRGDILDLARPQDRNHHVELGEQAFVGLGFSRPDLVADAPHVGGDRCGRLGCGHSRLPATTPADMV